MDLNLMNSLKEIDNELTVQQRQANRHWQKTNPKKFYSSQKDWKLRNPEKIKEYQKVWAEKNPERLMFLRAKDRALEKGWDFNIEVSDIKIPTHCPVLGIELKVGGNNQSSPSLDRIDSSKGYVKGNVHVISSRANMIKNNATVEELVKVANYFLILDKARKLSYNRSTFSAKPS